MRALKDEEVLRERKILMSEFMGDLIKDNLSNLPFSKLFTVNPILIPTPRSSLMQPGTLWVPQRLAHAFVRRGLGKGIEECLKRIKAVRKSATSQASGRPKTFEHYQSMEVQKIFPEPTEILLIDDIITRGATVLGATNKLAEAFPKAHICVFATMRTISPPDLFRTTFDPCIGHIELRGMDTFRRP
jgi:predicted amidophosphoribosyltransferase